MTGEEKRAWLDSICDKTRRIVATPFAATIDGKRYACASDAHVLVGLAGVDMAERPDAPHLGKVWKPGEWRSASLASLREWASCAEARRKREDCPGCNGEGYLRTILSAFDEDGDPVFSDLYEECGRCFAHPSEIHGIIGGAQFDRKLFRRALRGIDDDTVEWSKAADERAPILLRGDGWIAAIMPMRMETPVGPVWPEARHG